MTTITFTRKTYNKHHPACALHHSGITGRRRSIQTFSSMSESHRSAGKTKQNLPETALVDLAEEGCFKHSVEHMLRQRAAIETLPPANEHTEHNVTRYYANFSAGPVEMDDRNGGRCFSLRKTLALCADLSLFEESVMWREQTKLDAVDQLQQSHKTDKKVMMHTDSH